MTKNKTDISRRRFLRNLGLFTGAAAVSGMATMCKKAVDNAAVDSEGEGGMTMRVNHNTGDTVSILGYGCMRLPTVGMSNGTEDDTLDQEAINASVDAAMAGGVNYYIACIL